MFSLKTISKFKIIKYTYFDLFGTYYKNCIVNIAGTLKWRHKKNLL